MKSGKIRSRVFFTLIIILLAIAGIFIMDNAEHGVNTASEQALRIAAAADPDCSTTIEADQLGGYYESDIAYNNLKDVTIEIDRTVYPLEDAISNGLISVEEIISYACIDARNGHCREEYSSQHGLTRFKYQYSDIEISYVHDIYETPDGKNHLIQDFDIYAAGTSGSVNHLYFDETLDYSTRLDYEDWGLSFVVSESSNTGLVLHCTQSGGQHIGELEAHFYSIYSDTQPLNTVKDLFVGDVFPHTPIANNAATSITIDWTEIYGTIPPGEYLLTLEISDIYDPSTVHPLMNNFYDEQYYKIPFTVPA